MGIKFKPEDVSVDAAATAVAAAACLVLVPSFPALVMLCAVMLHESRMRSHDGSCDAARRCRVAAVVTARRDCAFAVWCLVCRPIAETTVTLPSPLRCCVAAVSAFPAALRWRCSCRAWAAAPAAAAPSTRASWRRRWGTCASAAHAARRGFGDAREREPQSANNNRADYTDTDTDTGT
jgi:hypothetical protein